MSNRFPPIAPPEQSSHPRARARVFALPQPVNLPWIELAMGLVLLVLLRQVS